jgi:hypothetical protein
MTETHEIIAGNYGHIEDVQVKFTIVTPVETSQTYSEQDVLNTIASLEQQKIEFCAAKDQEIAINNQMLLKIRSIERPLNITE